MDPFPGSWGSDIFFSLEIFSRLDFSPSCSRNRLLGGQAALKFMSFSVMWRISELGPKMKETGLSQPKIVIKLLE